ncbi:hypothetical protein [uncultured Ramlibacter sp.]|uniref:hypothetical protein n=1 Tax=uncultured Ramlibacter sp. TaxID=260755 RepID=UPI0026112946|nr:hypothetical protein [uncultured Ramlibacter sp.]
MKHSLRKTASHLHLAYKYGESSDSLAGRHFMLEENGRELTLCIDLSPNFHIRNKSAASYLNAVTLAHEHHKLKFLQCSDNLVRARLIKAWERVDQPHLRLLLDLGLHGRYMYSVLPHSLFMGGIQFDVLDVLEDADEAPSRSRLIRHDHSSPRPHA